jgi:hypothetical protein
MTFKKAVQLLMICCLPSLFAVASSDSSLLKKVSFGYSMHNDDNFISNQKDYSNRNRDDHGLTFQYGFSLGVNLEIFKNSNTDLNFRNNNSLYTKGLGTNSIITNTHPNYADYEYLKDKHPDLDEIFVLNQIAYSKSLNQLDLINRYKHLRLGVSLKYTTISSRENQFMTNAQRKFHKFTKARNYTHEAFTDSSIFGSQKFHYFSIASIIGYEANWVDNDFMLVRNRIDFLFWFNSTNSYSISAVSPRFHSELLFGFGKPSSANHRLFELTGSVQFEPLEIIQEFSDPGSNGFIHMGFNFLLKKPKNDNPTLYAILTPYSLYIPFMKEFDVTLNYVAPKKDKRIVEGFANLKIIYKIQ